MGSATVTSNGLTAKNGDAGTRLPRADRRTVLLAVASALAAESGADGVTMESVAARAKVSRPLVYKHFANRRELLAAVYRDEAARLDAEIVAAVEAVTGFEAKVRAVISALIEAELTRGQVFGSLVRSGARDEGFLGDQQRRDRRTVRYFSALAADEFRLDRERAKAAMSVLLTGIDSIMAQWRARPDPARRRLLEDLYVELVVGGLRAVAGRKEKPRGSTR